MAGATMTYRRCGTSGLLLPAVSLGLWQNFGGTEPFERSRALVLRAFGRGVTHFDLANNYGPPPGSAEETFGRILAGDLRAHRDEMVVTTKAGYGMWEGPYGDGGSRKYLVASLDQSLRRMGLDYVDIFYHHRPDPATPLEETMGALDGIVRSGKALYAGISNYDAAGSVAAIDLLQRLGTRCLVHQVKYSMLARELEGALGARLAERGVGVVAFSPLAQGLLTDRYLGGIPDGSRASKASSSIARVEPADIERARKLAKVAAERGQTVAQLAVSWVLRRGRVCSAIVGASRIEQLDQLIDAQAAADLDDGQVQAVERILQGR